MGSRVKNLWKVSRGLKKGEFMEENKKWSIMPLIRTFAVILVLGGIALGAMAFTSSEAAIDNVAFLDDDGENPDRPFFGKGDSRRFPGGHFAGFSFGGELDYDSFLADALGITVQELQDAHSEARAAMLRAAVEKGLITEDQVELMEARRNLMEHIDHEALLAEALGINVEDLQKAREGERPLSDLFDELGLEPEAVREAMQATYEKAVQEAVSAGVITQTQADQILEDDGGFPMFGGRGGIGGRGRFPGGEFRNPCTPDTDTSEGASL
jgi:hypothetical protein